jgi:hypothetical protein
MIDYIVGLTLPESASLLSLLISIYLLFGVRKIKKDFVRFIHIKTRIPELRSELELSSSTISQLMNEFPETIRGIRFELRKTVAILKNIKPKVNTEGKKTIVKLMKIISYVTKQKRERGILFNSVIKINGHENLEERIYEIHGSINALILEIKHLEEDQNWSIKNE